MDFDSLPAILSDYQGPLSLIAVVVVWVIINFFPRPGSKRRYFKNRRDYPKGAPLYKTSELFRPNLSDPAVALRYVKASTYTVRPLMNRETYALFAHVERFFKEVGQGHRVIPEVCMGAVLGCSDDYGFSSINSKRLDIGVIDRAGNLILAIEYNGGGHYQNNAAGRDAVKRLALNKARIPMVEVIPDDDYDRILEKLNMNFLRK